MEFEKLGGIGGQPLKPGEFVAELGSRIGITVWQVQTSNQHAINGCLDIAAVRVIGVARQAFAGQQRLFSFGKDRHAIPTLLAMPDCAVASGLDGLDRELGVR